MDSNTILLVIAAVLILVAGGVLGFLYCKHRPSERAMAFKAAAALTKRLAALQSTAPEDMASAAATQASEATLLAQFKAAVLDLK